MSSNSAPEISTNGVCIMLSGIIASFVIGYLLAWYTYGYPSKLDTAHSRPPSRFSASTDTLMQANTPNKGPNSERFHSGLQSQHETITTEEPEQTLGDHDSQVVDRMRSTAGSFPGH